MIMQDFCSFTFKIIKYSTMVYHSQDAMKLLYLRTENKTYLNTIYYNLGTIYKNCFFDLC